MRIGELLLQDGVITPRQLEAALRTQRQYGGRVASTLVDLGCLDVDVAARALGRQLQVPCAVQKHFDAVEPNALDRVSRKAAEAYTCIPLGFSLKQAKTIVVAFVDPTRLDVLQEVQMVVGMRVLAAIAPEVRMEQALQRYYGVAPKRHRDAVRVDNVAPPMDLDDRVAPALSSAPTTGPYRATSLRPDLTLDPPMATTTETTSTRSLPPLVSRPPESVAASAPPFAAPPPPAFDWKDIHETAASSPHAKRARDAGSSSEPPAPPPPPPPPRTSAPPRKSMPSPPSAFRRESRHPTPYERPGRTSSRPRSILAAPQALAALHIATSRDEVAEIIVDHLRLHFGVGVVFITRNDVAVGWKGFAPAVAGHGIESLAIPLTHPSVLSIAYESHEMFRGAPPAEGDEMHERLWKSLRTPSPQESIVVPIVVSDRTVNLVYAHAIDGAPSPASAVRDFTTVCQAATVAYGRMLRDSRPKM